MRSSFGRLSGNKTISDVALHAGVSIRTVSRVLNRSPLVNVHTREKVESAIAHFSFRPSPRARGLRTGRSYLIGLIHNDRNALVLEPVQGGIVREAAHRGYELVVHPTLAGYDASVEDVMSFIARSKVDGVIIMSPASSIAHLAETLSAAALPAVALASIALDGFAAVIVSAEREASRDVAHCLVKLGHRKIALLNGPGVSHAAQERRAGFVEALAADGVALLAEAEGDYGFESGFRGAQALLSGPIRPTAIFVTNDIMAAGALKAAAAANLSVPRDLSIVGFDDSIIAQMLTPAITTVHRPMANMAARATSCLVDIIEGVPTERLIVEPLSLTIGDSTAAPPA